MAVLFELPDLAAYMQTDLDASTASLVRDLVTADIRAAAGAARFDALTDLSPLKGLALEAAKRRYLNPSGLRSEQIDDYQVTYGQETITGPGLTPDEVAAVLRVVGVSGAFTIRPAAPASCAWRGVRWRET